MIQKIERMHIIDQLPDGRYKVSGIEGTYTKAELERLKAVILADSAGIHLWVK